MKKYIKTILLLLITIVPISIYYISATVLASGQPTYYFATMSGDATEIEDVVVRGHYSEGYSSDDITITENKTTYYRHQPMWQKMLRSPNNAAMKALQKEHWSFTRGKGTDFVNYFEDDTSVAYSSLIYDYSYKDTKAAFIFEVAVLNKTTNKTKSFEVKLPNAEGFNYVNTERVQMVGDDLHVLTKNTIGDHYNENYYLYIFDLAQEQLKSGELVFANPNSQSKEQEIEYYHLNQMGTNELKDRVLFFELARTGQDVADVSLHIYHFTTGEFQTVSLPDVIYDADYPHLYDETHLYFTKQGPDRTEILGYNMASNKIDIVLTYEGAVMALAVDEGKLYGVMSVEDDSQLEVLDVVTGESLYRGELTTDQKDADISNVNFYYIDMK